jgi:hypothetical protein
MKMSERWRRELRSLLSLGLFLAVVAFLFQSWELALMLTACLSIHELGHILAVSCCGVDWHMGFGPVGAWIETPLEARRRLSHFANSLIHLTGPLFNLLYALLALTIHALLVRGGGQDYWLRIANLSAMVALLNGLPIGGASDGGKFAARLFASLDERTERRLLWGLLPGLLSLGVIVLITRGDALKLLAVLLIGLWFVADMMRQSRLDDPREATAAHAMSDRQSVLLLLGVAVLLLVSTLIVLLTPLWLQPDHVLAMVEALARLVVLVLTRYRIVIAVGLTVLLGLLARRLLRRLLHL